MKKMSTGSRIFDISNYIFLTLFAFICCYPFYYLIIYSLSDSVEAAKGIVLFWPRGLNFITYKTLLVRKDIMTGVFISVSRVILGTGVTMFCSAFFAYLLSKKTLIFRKLMYRMMVITMYLNAGLIPYYITMKNYGFKNNFLLYIIPSAIVPFYVILIKTYMEQLPECMEESAKVDGASYFLIFIRIIMPLSLPVLATVAIYSAVTQWNTWQDNFYLVHSRSLKTLQLLLLDYLQTMNQNIINNVSEASQRAWQVSTTTIQMSISVISMIPILLVYPFLQRYFVKGIMLGAVKG